MQYEEPNEDGNISTIFKTTIKYVDTRIDLLKLSFIKKASDGISSLISLVVALVFLMLALIILSIGLAIWLGQVFGGLYYGFFAVGGLFIIVGIILFILKSTVIKGPVSSAIIKKVI